METKHTKGEWYFCMPEKDSPFASNSKWIEASLYTKLSNKPLDTKSIGKVSFTSTTYSDLEDIEKAEANMKLISSAPELLEALIEANEALEWFMSNTAPDNKNDYQSYHDTGMNARYKAKQAISKATGV